METDPHSWGVSPRKISKINVLIIRFEIDCPRSAHGTMWYHGGGIPHGNRPPFMGGVSPHKISKIDVLTIRFEFYGVDLPRRVSTRISFLNF